MKRPEPEKVPVAMSWVFEVDGRRNDTVWKVVEEMLHRADLCHKARTLLSHDACNELADLVAADVQALEHWISANREKARADAEEKPQGLMIGKRP
jgi:hypothetical protein